jgi:DNA-binding beta-propeller fold protein YncE
VSGAEGLSGYRLIKSVAIEGANGSYGLGLDQNNGDVLITMADRVVIVSNKDAHVIGGILGLSDVRTVVVAGHKAIMTEGTPNRLVAFDTRTLKKLYDVAVGRDPGAVVFDPASGRAFTFNYGSNDATVIEIDSGRTVGTVALNGHPSGAAADGKGIIFVSLTDRNEVAAIDSTSLEVKAHYPLPRCMYPRGMAIDIAHWLIFSACANSVIAVTRMYSGESIATIPSAPGTEEVRYDPMMKRVFSLSALGTLTVAREVNPLHFQLLGSIEIGGCAYSMEQDPDRHRLVIAAAVAARTPSDADCRAGNPAVKGAQLLEFGLQNSE